MGKRFTKFEMGYLCAVANTISMHGADTSEWDTFKSLGRSLREVLNSKSVDDFDKEHLSELKGFDPDYREESK